jgi:NNP family nitrate/nitrite transporter-like MFS transporter
MNDNLKGTPSRGLLGTTIGFFFGFAAVALYGPTAVKFREAMDLTPAMVGFLVAIPSLSGSLLRIPFGAWVDITGGRKPFLILLGLSALGLGGVTLLLYLQYPSGMKGLYPLVLFLGMLSGCGIATFPVGIGQTSYWFPLKKQGKALGIYAGLGNIAPGLFSLILPVYLIHYGFISAYFAWFVFLFAGIIIYWFVGVNSYYFQLRKAGFTGEESINKARAYGQQLFPSGNVKDSFINSIRSKKTWSLIILYFTSFGGFIALTAWFPVYWSEAHGFSPVKAGFLTAVFSLLASGSRVIGGSLADRAGGEKTSMVSLVIIFVSSLALIFTDAEIHDMTAIIILAAGMGINNAAVFKMVPYYVPDAIGGAAGWIGGLGAFGGFIIPPVLGEFVNHFGNKGYAGGFFIFAVLSLISLIIVFRLSRKQ